MSSVTHCLTLAAVPLSCHFSISWMWFLCQIPYVCSHLHKLTKCIILPSFELQHIINSWLKLREVKSLTQITQGMTNMDQICMTEGHTLCTLLTLPLKIYLTMPISDIVNNRCYMFCICTFMSSIFVSCYKIGCVGIIITTLQMMKQSKKLTYLT